jgi:hypothetical protein
MLKKILTTLLYGGCALALLTSCGSSKASGTGEFATVFATASPGVSNLDSDVAKWSDAAGAAATACSIGASPTFAPDDVAYNITVTPYTSANTGSTSPIAVSDLIITKVTVTLTPANSITPALPASSFQTQFVSSGGRLIQGATNPVTVRVVPADLKSFFFNTLGVNCSNPGTFFTYRATVSFEAQEINTQRVSTITAPGFLVVSVADFGDTATP